MNDMHPDPTWRPPAMRISATYPATDGSMPEEVIIELDGETAAWAPVGALLEQLLMAPHQRYLETRQRDKVKRTRQFIAEVTKRVPDHG